MRLPDPARSRVVLIGTASHASGSDLPDLPAVGRNLDGLADALAAPGHGWLTQDALRVLCDPEGVGTLGARLVEWSQQAEDLLLVYYGGHGLLDAHGSLYLALPNTRRDLLRFTAFPFDGLREVIADSPAKNRVLILDCCYSGRAVDAMGASDADVYGQIEIAGSYTLSSTTANALAVAPAGARYTVFSGALISLLRDGAVEGPDPLTLDFIYRHVYRAMVGAGYTRPQQRGTDSAVHLELARNPARLALRDRTGSAVARAREGSAWADQVGLAGDPGEAARRLAPVVDRMIDACGSRHPLTLALRHNHAFWVGEAGDPEAAARLFAALVEDRVQHSAADLPDTLRGRAEHARWVGLAGDPAEAVRLFGALAEPLERVSGADHQDMLALRHDHAFWVGEAGDPATAAQLFSGLVEDRARVLGPEHPETVSSRHEHARWTGCAGDPAEAARLLGEVVDVSARLSGLEHPDTLASRCEHARWIGRSGHPARAADLLASLAAACHRSLGPEHPLSVVVGRDAAAWKQKIGREVSTPPAPNGRRSD